MSHAIDCSAISYESMEVFRHLGPEAPAKLNAYACAIEDALLESVAHQRILQEQLSSLNAEREQMRLILNDPEQLIAYVNGLFGPDGPCPAGEAISRLDT